MALALRHDREYNGHEIVIERPDGTRRTALAHANPIRDSNGTTVGAVNVLVDITDRKRTEDAPKTPIARKTSFSPPSRPSSSAKAINWPRYVHYDGNAQLTPLSCSGAENRCPRPDASS
jgi:hypothetical protein